MAADTAAATQRPLGDLMLAMDVVDTLRHRETLVARELADEDRDARLIERLREIYRAQGIEVSDAILAEGVRALKESRFVYSPPEDGLQVRLARLYVRRRVWGRRLGTLAAVLLLAAAAWHVFVTMPSERRAEALHVEMTQTLPRALEHLAGHVAAMTDVADALRQAEAAHAAGEQALQVGNVEAARKAVAELEALEARLAQEYVLRIVSRPGATSGLWRIPDVNQEARNYYLVVEALDRNGRPLSVPITNEETGETGMVSQWGVRVPETTFARVRADKEDDGIIQNDILGAKRRGHLEPVYMMPVSGGAITDW
ncbi:hypothetical protein EDC22_11345 [Tepidamorphus gemmatus]|uniref:Uncharacterized protein n=1 Tax=Tepidamorphus gemmatus TaxID=747076 RepID=A0A4R3LXZ3_9HYPH|nr:DUF6384 family protein [Tepidamorphus gemmatus]TCT05423.1 hypothetical protein EDC22_11345 [Tepidamorphus gemmatus]